MAKQINVYKLFDRDANNFNTAEMQAMIHAQNTATYDGGRPMRHSADALIKFLGIDKPSAVKRFNVAYAALYSA